MKAPRPTPQLNLFTAPAPLLPAAPPPPVEPPPPAFASEPAPLPPRRRAPRTRPIEPDPPPAPEPESEFVSADEAIAMLRAAREAAQAEERARERARAAIPPELRGARHASVFFLENGRLPRIGDEIPPWRYCGWLLPYVQGLHSKNFPLLGDRWGYYQRTLAAGRLLDEPIPQARFEHPHTPTLRALEKWVSLIEVAGVAAWNSLVVFVDWLAWALDVGPEPTHRLDDALQEKLYRTVNLELWLENPSDYLGAVASERYGGGPLAFFPTPHSICTMMAQMVMADVDKQPDGRDPRLLTINEPCCGTGRLLLVASNYSMCLSGQDIAPLMVAITKINLAVYAPWGLHGLPWLHNPALGLRLADALTDKPPSR